MNDPLTKKWILFGVNAGILGDLLYPILLAVPNLPDFIKIVMGGMFGILIGVSGFGIAKFLDLHLKTISAKLGAIFLFTGGAMMNLMIVIQQTLVGYFTKYHSQTSDEAVIQILRWVERGTTPIHLGIDISWDFFLYIATFLFGIAMYNHPKFGKLWGLLGMTLSAKCRAACHQSVCLPIHASGFGAAIYFRSLVGRLVPRDFYSDDSLTWLGR